VGYVVHMRTSVVQDALDMAVDQRRPDPEALLIYHSDRGCQPNPTGPRNSVW
jgi:transposase InsO family protein